jgi:hypothetical protein
VRGLTDDRLNLLLANVPERSFVLIEDVDAAFNKRVQSSADGYVHSRLSIQLVIEMQYSDTNPP